VIACTALAVLGIVLLSGGSGGYVIRAEFVDAQGLQPDFSVRVQGVVVGHVSAVSVTRHDRALVTLSLDPAVAPVGTGASATIAPSNLLGEKYVLLRRGDLRKPLPSGTLVPLARTSSAPELDQVLGAFDQSTRQATAIFLAEQGNALLDRGQDLGAVLAALPGSLQSGQQLLAGLAHNTQALGRLIDESDRVLATATPQRAPLGRLISGADGALATLAGRERALGNTIIQAPSTLAQLRATLVELQNAAGPLGQAARGLRTTAPSLTATLNALPGFADAAIPTLHTATQTAPALQRLGTQATPVVAALQPTAARLASFSSYLGPVSTLLDNNAGTLLDVIQGWARAIADRDGIGHIYRVEALLPNNTLASVLGAAGVSLALRRQFGLLGTQNPTHRHTAAPRTSPISAAAPAASVSPAAPTSPAHPTPAPPTSPVTAVLPKLLGGLLGPPPSTPPGPNRGSGVAGLLHFLLGR
jgi:phospholipid/cholesterol/gamma-HCH transport system substrate-binding protein